MQSQVSAAGTSAGDAKRGTASGAAPSRGSTKKTSVSPASAKMRAHVPPILPHTPEIAIRMPPPPFSFQFMPVRV